MLLIRIRTLDIEYCEIPEDVSKSSWGQVQYKDAILPVKEIP